MQFIKTVQAAKLLGVPFWRINYLIRCGRIAPTKGPDGDYYWSDQDIALARQVIALDLRKKEVLVK